MKQTINRVLEELAEVIQDLDNYPTYEAYEEPLYLQKWAVLSPKDTHTGYAVVVDCREGEDPFLEKETTNYYTLLTDFGNKIELLEIEVREDYNIVANLTKEQAKDRYLRQLHLLSSNKDCFGL